MKRLFLLLMALALPLPAMASHPWSGIDLCDVYQDKLPPGLTAEALPEPLAVGAGLLNQYCTQCHNLPGPDRHTTVEWRQVTAKMFLLMDVSHQFGGLMGRVEIMNQHEQEILVDYLVGHAMRSVERIIPPPPGRAHHWLSSVVALGPLVLLIGLGIFRWWKTNREHRRPCVID